MRSCYITVGVLRSKHTEVSESEEMDVEEVMEYLEDIGSESESDGSEEDAAIEEFEADSSENEATVETSASTRPGTASAARPRQSPVEYNWEEVTESKDI